MSPRSSSTAHKLVSAVSGLLVAFAFCGLLDGCIGSGDDSVVPVPSTDAATDAAADHTAGDAGDASYAADATTADAGDGSTAPPTASLSATSINFGAVACGSTSMAETLTITNTGGSTLSVSATEVGSAFSISGSTALSIGSGMAGTITVTATIPGSASAGSTVTGSLSLFTNDPLHPNISLVLSATPTGATLQGTSQYSFASTEIGVASPAVGITLTNTGNAPATFAFGTPSDPSVTLSGLPSGGTVVNAMSTLNGSAVYLPVALSPAGGTTATVAITATGPTCGESLTALQFTGQTATGNISGWPSNNTIDFGPAPCDGVAPAAQTITLINSGATAARITQVDTSAIGGFTTNAAVGAQIAPGGGTLTLTFGAPPVPAPTTSNPSVSLSTVTGTVTISTDASATGTLITLTEEPQGAVLAFSTPSTPGCTMAANFGDFTTPVLLLESSPPEFFCVVNTGNAPANVTLSATDNEAASEAGAPDSGALAAFSLAVQSFSIAAPTAPPTPSLLQDALTFTPLQAATATTGSLSMGVDSTTTLCQLLPAPLPLSGTASGGGPVVTPTSLTFPATCGGGAPQSQSFVVENSGTANLTWALSSMTGLGTGQYQVTANPPPGVLAPNAQAVVTVSATAVGSPAPSLAALAAQITVTTDVPLDVPHVVSLSEVPIGDQLSLSAGTLAFGQIPIGTSVSHAFAVVNNANPGSSDANVTFSLSGAGASAYSQPLQTGGSFGAGSSAIETVIFDPATAMADPAIITFSTSDPLCAPLPSPLVLSGTGTAGAVSLSATTLTFGQPGDPRGLVSCGSTGTTQSLTISNVGNQSFDLTSVTLGKGSSSPYTLSGPATTLPTLGFTGSSATTTLTITPEAIPSIADPNDPSVFGDVLTIATDAAGDTPHAVSLVMQARGAVITNTPLSTTWNFGSVGAGSIGTFTTPIQNTGNASATLSLQGLTQPSIFGLENNPTTVQAFAVTELVGQFTPPSSNGSWTDSGQLVLSAPDSLCAPLPSQWNMPTIALSGTSNASAAFTLAGSLVFPTTECGGDPPSAQSVTLSNSTNQAYSYAVKFASGAWYTLVDSGLGNLAANGATTIVVTPKPVIPGQGVLPGSAPYADDLILTVATSPAATTFTVPIAWTLSGAVLSLPEGAGPNASSQGNFYVADSTSGFALPMANSGTATASVSLAIQPAGAFSIQPAPPVSVLPGITSLPEFVSGPSPACPTTSGGSATFVYSGPVCQPFALGSVSVRSCTGTYAPTGVGPSIDAGTSTIDASSAADAEADAAAVDGAAALTACTSSPCPASSVQCSGNNDGACTSTEAIFVNFDISKGLVTAAGPEPDTGACYACLLSAGCLDDQLFGDTGHECGVDPQTGTSDLSATFTNGSGTSVNSTTTCLATAQCVISTGCGTAANGGLTNCYCGSEGGGPSACATATAVNGNCKTQELAGFLHTDNSDIINKDFTNTLEPSGMANEIFSCGKDTCPQCLP
ncbi:MAG TPA: choice-of-anchor D domain-containing protein [Polyangiaceae bacterium]|nr:choice-of-anchor D domain-containing protein [Polyangiaceae bacterium]